MKLHRLAGRRPIAIVASIIVVALAAAMPGVPVAAQGALPGVANVPPPSWVQPGVRVTFYSAAAAVGGSRSQLIEDPTGPWVDPATGKHYRDTGETGESLGGASGDGVSQVDVVAVEGNDVVLSMNLYGIDRATNTLIVKPGVGARVPGGAVEGLWIAPQLLAQARTGSLGGLLVLQGPYQLNGTTYQAVSIVNPTPGAYSSVTYDTSTGVLLASTTNTAGAVSPVQLPGQGPTQGASQLTISRFVSIRQMTTPGIGSVAPAWVGRSPALDYAGQYQWVNPVGGAANGSGAAPMQAQVTFTATGPTWATYEVRTVIDMPGAGAPGSSTGASSGIGPYWWDPAALARFSPGQPLDQDPVTGMTVMVGDIGQGPAGPAVTITSTIPGTTGQASYDLATGVLVGQAFSIAASGATIVLGLQGMP